MGDWIGWIVCEWIFYCLCGEVGLVLEFLVVDGGWNLWKGWLFLEYIKVYVNLVDCENFIKKKKVKMI